MATQASYFFYDLETFGLNPKKDRIAQFAGIRTDAELNIIEPPVTLYCQPSIDYIPNPESLLITGITLEECEEKGINEAEFSLLIKKHFSRPHTTILGYNTIRFDDEMIRYLFYRNFIDPYAHTWQHNNSRWDLLDVVRATFALRPDGICWPTSSTNANKNDEPQTISLRLEDLTKANNLHHEKAHDALSDVYATLALAKLLREKQPRLFNYFFQHRKAKTLKETFSLTPHQTSFSHTPLVHVSGMFGAERHYLSVVTPIAYHPWNPNALISIDLMGKIEPLLDYSAEELKAHLFTKKEHLPEGLSSIPIKLIHLNKAPILAPLGVLQKKYPTTLNQAKIKENQQKLMASLAELQRKVTTIFAEKYTFSPTQDEPVPDPEEELYAGFFERNDQQHIATIRNLSFDELAHQSFDFDDPRLSPLLFRYRARNAFYSLSEVEKSIWQPWAKRRRVQYQKTYTPLYHALLEGPLTSKERELLKSCQSYYHPIL